MSKVKLHPELKPDQGKGTPTEEPKKTWSEKHPKVSGFFKKLPGVMLNAGKKILGGIIIVGGGIVLGVIGIEATRPKHYGEFPLQVPETPRPALPVLEEKPGAELIKEVETVLADPEVEVTTF